MTARDDLHKSRVYALVKALRESVGPELLLSTLIGARDEAGLSSLELLRRGKYADAEQVLRPYIFRDQPVQRRQVIVWQGEDPEPPPLPSGSGFRPPTHRARRISLRK